MNSRVPKRTSETARPWVSMSKGALLAVVEPPRDDGDDTSMALRSQAQWLAEELGIKATEASWRAGEPPDPERLADNVVRLAREAEVPIVLFSDGDLGRQLAPMVAFDLGTSAVVGCDDVLVHQGAVVWVKPVYGGWLQREFSYRPGYVQVATVRSALVTPPTDVSPVVVLLQDQLDADTAAGEPAIAHLEVVPPDPRTVDIVHARRVVGAGAGSASAELLEAVARLAGLLEGSVGATRPVVDDGRLPKERLIGQTGKTVAPDLYLALGISGSPHHVAGVQGAGRIVAVNRDDHAQILSFSDAAYIADLEILLPALVQRITEWQSGLGEERDDD